MSKLRYSPSDNPSLPKSGGTALLPKNSGSSSVRRLANRIYVALLGGYRVRLHWAMTSWRYWITLAAIASVFVLRWLINFELPHGLALASQGPITIAISPSSKAVSVGEIFTLDIQIDAGIQPVDTAATFINFDPAYLEVVDENGDPLNQISPGLTLPNVLQNSIDNNKGQIDYVAGVLIGTPPSGSFTLATIRFKAKTQTGEGTLITFVFSPPARNTDVLYQGLSVLTTHVNGNVTISEGMTCNVSIKHIQSAATRWRQTFGPHCDNDGVITVKDIMCFATLLGEPCDILAMLVVGSAEMAPGATVTVPIELRGVENLVGTGIEIWYDPSVIDATGCKADPNGTFGFAHCELDSNNDGVGTDVIGFSSLSSTGVSGNILLAEVTFQAVGNPGDTSILDAVIMVIGDIDQNPILTIDQDGHIDITTH